MSSVLARHESRGVSYLRGGEGPSLLLLHGLPGSSRSWRSVGQRLASEYDVIIPDLTGFGHSEGAEAGLHLDHEFYLEAYAETVQGLLDDLDLATFFLGGHGFGGAVALTLIRLFPEQVPERLALVAPKLLADTPGSWLLRFAGMPGLGPLAVRFVAGTRIGLRLLYRIAVQHKSEFTADDFERHLTPSGIDQTRRIVQRGLVGRRKDAAGMDALLTRLDVPTLLVCGDCDPFFPLSEAERLADMLPNATVVVFEETGHFIPEERSGGVAGYIEDFFRAHSSCPPRPVWERWSSS